VVCHISRKTSETPNFLYAALDRTACAPFIKERRRKFWEPTKLLRKSGDAPNFLYAALDRSACAPFIKERRMNFRELTNSTGNRGCGAPGIGCAIELKSAFLIDAEGLHGFDS
jgi:hypothetical protein